MGFDCGADGLRCFHRESWDQGRKLLRKNQVDTFSSYVYTGVYTEVDGEDSKNLSQREQPGRKDT